MNEIICLKISAQPNQWTLLSASIHHRWCQNHQLPPPLQSQTSSLCSRKLPDRWGRPRNKKHSLETRQLPESGCSLYICSNFLPSDSESNWTLYRSAPVNLLLKIEPQGKCDGYILLPSLETCATLDSPQQKPSYQSNRLCWRTRICGGKDRFWSQCTGLKKTRETENVWKWGLFFVFFLITFNINCHLIPAVSMSKETNTISALKDS